MTARTCGCGCGEVPPIAKQTDRRKGHVRGEPVRFVRGHENRGRRNTPKLIEIGERFGRWTVIAEAGVDHRQSRVFKCRCDCGSEREVVGSNLRRGATTSCGCRREENEQWRLLVKPVRRSNNAASTKTKTAPEGGLQPKSRQARARRGRKVGVD